MNLAELLITVNTDSKSIQIGLIYLHVAHKALFNTLNFININRYNKNPYFLQYFINYEKQYISLYLRSLTMMGCAETKDNQSRLKLFVKANSLINENNICVNSVFCLNKMGKFLKKLGKHK